MAALAMSCGNGGASAYDVQIVFNETVTQEDMDDVADLLESYDADVDVLVQEIFPPIAVARVETEVPDFCAVVTVELGGRSYIDDVFCEKARGKAPSGGDAPVRYP
jgi:hypothetical protein